MLSHFKAVSVREYSAVEICSKNFGVEATHVLDPTLLLSVENYIELIKNKKVSASKGSLGVYVLDENKEVNDFGNSDRSFIGNLTLHDFLPGIALLFHFLMNFVVSWSAP